MKESFVFYRSFYEAISKIKNKELKADIFEAICELGLNNNVIDLEDNIGQIIIDLIRPQIVANNERYEKGLTNGRLGGRPNEYNQKEIISLIENGFSNKEISEKIGCSLSSVKYYRQKLDNKSITVKNSNVNENDNVNVNENDNVNDFIISTTTNNKKDIFVVIEEEFGRTLSSTEIERITQLENEYGYDKFVLAVKECCLKNNKNISYLNGILKNWKDKTLDEIKPQTKKEELDFDDEFYEITDYDWLNENEEE